MSMGLMDKVIELQNRGTSIDSSPLLAASSARVIDSITQKKKSR